jgi:hypothetical protein
MPPGLEELVLGLSYKPGWRFALNHRIDEDGSGGLRFEVTSDTDDSIRPGRRMHVLHAFLVPPASYNRETWAAWLFDRVRDVESHEAAEFFRIDDYREFAPHHSNGEDPYRVWHVGDHQTARKRSGDA